MLLYEILDIKPSNIPLHSVKDSNIRRIVLSKIIFNNKQYSQIN